MRICFYSVSDATEPPASLPFGIDEQARLSAIKHPARKKESLAALLALRALTGDAPSPILRTSEGKPYFADPTKPPFSLCHGGGWAAAALSEGTEGQVGIDLELLRPYPTAQAVADRFFSPEEYSEYSQAGKSEEAFFRVWTKKEARSKLTGKGFLANKASSVYTRALLLRAPCGTLVVTVAAEREIPSLSIHAPSKQCSEFQIEEI